MLERYLAHRSSGYDYDRADGDAQSALPPSPPPQPSFEASSESVAAGLGTSCAAQVRAPCYQCEPFATSGKNINRGP